MAGMGLSAAKTKLQQDIQKALEDAFKATFIMGSGDFGDEIARKFAQKGAKPIADAIDSFIKQAQITGTINGIVTGTCGVGPVSGSNTDILSGTELSLV